MPGPLAVIYTDTMRLSGNYFDRLLFNIAPFTFFATVLIYFSRTDLDIEVATFIFIITTLLFWSIDSSFLFFKLKNPKPLVFKNSLFWGKDEILTKDITKITPLIDKRLRWTFKMVEFTLTDGRKFTVIDKPQNLIEYIMDRPSKCIKQLLQEFPELKSKVAQEKNI